jgi:hypothetical protein
VQLSSLYAAALLLRHIAGGLEPSRLLGALRESFRQLRIFAQRRAEIC